MTENWKHQTAEQSVGNGPTVGVDLFDDEYEGQVSIYTRFANGTRWPARTLLKSADHFDEVLAAWTKGDVNDYRSNP